jgi:hypothetical protein
VLQASPQTPLLEQNDEPPVIIGQGAQLGPHEFSELGTHCWPQRLVPAGQVKPQAPLVHTVVVPVGPAGHALHELPQVATDELLTHWSLHS